MTAARANNQQTVDSTGGTCFDPTVHGAAGGIVVACHSSSTKSVLVNVAPLHNASEFFEIEPGKSQPFRPPGGSAQSGSLGKVTIKGLNGSAIVGWGIFA